MFKNKVKLQIVTKNIYVFTSKDTVIERWKNYTDMWNALRSWKITLEMKKISPYEPSPIESSLTSTYSKQLTYLVTLHKRSLCMKVVKSINYFLSQYF